MAVQDKIIELEENTIIEVNSHDMTEKNAIGNPHMKISYKSSLRH